MLSLSSCGRVRLNNSSFSQDVLSSYGLSESFPMPDIEHYSTYNNTLYVYLDDSIYESYIRSIYEYLASGNYYYVGTYYQKGLVAEMLPDYVYKEIDNKYDFTSDKQKFVYSTSSELNNGTYRSFMDPCYRVKIKKNEEKRFLFSKEKYNVIITIDKMPNSVRVIDEQ